MVVVNGSTAGERLEPTVAQLIELGYSDVRGLVGAVRTVETVIYYADGDVNAADRMRAEIRAAMPEDATTLHRLLGSIPESPYFRHDAAHPLAVDAVIVVWLLACTLDAVSGGDCARLPEALEAYRRGIVTAEAKGDKQAAKEMTVFARRIEKQVLAPPAPSA